MPFQVRTEVDASEVRRIVRSLAAINKRLARKALRKAVTVAGRVVRDDAKNRVAVRTGLLRKSLGVRVRTYLARGVVVAVVGPRRGFRRDVPGVGTVDPVNYAHLVEYGTNKSAAKPFLRPAWDENKERIVAAMRGILEESLRSARA